MRSASSHFPRKRLSRSQRREAIVEAALRLFSRRGYRGATTRDLAREAGITEVTLFRHFPTKEDLFGAVIEKYSILPVLRQELADLQRGGNPLALLRDLARRVLKILYARKDMIRLVLSESIVNPDQAQMFVRQGPGRIVGDMTKLLEAMHERGEIRTMDFETAARAFLGTMFSYLILVGILQPSEPKESNLEQVADAVVDLFWRGMRPETEQQHQEDD